MTCSLDHAGMAPQPQLGRAAAARYAHRQSASMKDVADNRHMPTPNGSSGRAGPAHRRRPSPRARPGGSRGHREAPVVDEFPLATRHPAGATSNCSGAGESGSCSPSSRWEASSAAAAVLQELALAALSFLTLLRAGGWIAGGVRAGAEVTRSLWLPFGLGSPRATGS